MEQLVYTAKEGMDMLKLGRTYTQELLSRAAETGEPFVVMRIGKSLRVRKDSFDALFNDGCKGFFEK